MDQCLSDRKRRRYPRCDRCRQARRGCDGYTRSPRAPYPNVSSFRPKSCSRCLRLMIPCSFEAIGKSSARGLPRAIKRNPLDAGNPLSAVQNHPCPASIGDEDDIAASDGMFKSKNTGFVDGQITACQSVPVELKGPDLTHTNQRLDTGFSYAQHNFTATSISQMASLSHDHESLPLTGIDPGFTAPKSVPDIGQTLQDIVPNPLMQPPNNNNNNNNNNNMPNLTFSTEMNEALVDSTQTPLLSANNMGDLPFGSSFGQMQEYARQLKTDLAFRQSELVQRAHHMDFKVCSLNCTLEDCPWRLAKRGDEASTNLPVTTSASNTFNVWRPQQTSSMTLNGDMLVQTNNKSMIVSLLMQVYRGAVENALQCWTSQHSCPFERAISDPRALGAWAKPVEPSSEINLYSRALSLDCSLSRFKKTPMTREESSAAAKALKLSILAFASQWRRSPVRTAQNQGASRFPAGHDGYQASHIDPTDFEARLRTSLWNQASKYLDRRLTYDSFRDIIAKLLFIMTQPPGQDVAINAKVLGALGQNNASSSCRATSDTAMSQQEQANSSRSSTTLGQDSSGLEDIPDYKKAREYMLYSLRQLLEWKRRIFHHPNGRSSGFEVNPTQGLTVGEARSFKVLFWIAVMGDTTASAMANKPFVMSDQDCGLAFSIESNQPRRLAQNDFTSLDSPRGPLHADSSSFSNIPIFDLSTYAPQSWINSSTLILEEVERRLYNVTPLKVLIWRKLGALQGAISANSSATKIENCIRDALGVYEFWSHSSRDFLKDCVAHYNQLTYTLQSWYVLLVSHWHLPCLKLAQYIEYIDANELSCGLGRALRHTSALTWELKMESVSSIAALARLSSGSSESYPATSSGNTSQFCSIFKTSILLTEPWTDLLIQAFITTGAVLSEWLTVWDIKGLGEGETTNPEHIWVYNKTQVNHLRDLCVDTIRGLNVLGSLSDTARLGAIDLERRLQR